MLLMQMPFRPLFLVCGMFLLSVSAVFGQVGDSHSTAVNAESDTVDIVYIGDSITYGGLLHSPDTQAPPVVCTELLRNRLPKTSFFMSNQGRNGHTTVDVLPSSNLDFPKIEEAATHLQVEHPGRLVFSIMLGTNDSAESGPNGSPVSAEKYGENLRTITSRLLLEYPESVVIINRPSWYSPNTHNGAIYDKPGLDRLQTYFSVITSVVRSFSGAPDRVYEGDTTAFDYFASHYQTDLSPEEGHEGTFYLHPDVQGAQALGELWSTAIADVLERHNRTTSDHPKVSK